MLRAAYRRLKSELAPLTCQVMEAFLMRKDKLWATSGTLWKSTKQTLKRLRMLPSWPTPGLKGLSSTSPHSKLIQPTSRTAALFILPRNKNDFLSHLICRRTWLQNFHSRCTNNRRESTILSPLCSSSWISSKRPRSSYKPRREGQSIQRSLLPRKKQRHRLLKTD